MTEVYLRLLERVLTPILLLIAVIFFLRGHDLPGGGFIAGLLAVAALMLQILSRGAEDVRDSIGQLLQPGAGIGLLIAVGAALWGLLGGGFFEGLWIEFDVGPSHIKLGTPLLFDLGVFITVVCFATSFLLGMSDNLGSDDFHLREGVLSRDRTPRINLRGGNGRRSERGPVAGEAETRTGGTA